MDLLETKNHDLLKRLRRLQVEHCCRHIDRQIGISIIQGLKDSDERTVGCFLSNIKHLESFDSDATESISSNDSYDELEGFSHEEIPPRKSNYLQRYPNTYNSTPSTPASTHHHHQHHHHHHQQQLQQQQSHSRRGSIQSASYGHNASVTNNGNIDTSDLKRKAIWKWANERGRLASRWEWLQAQVTDLEFRIRCQNDATKHARAYKVPPLPPVLPENTCSRTVPISRDFRRRRLIKSSQILSNSNSRLVKLSHVPCICSSLPQTVGPCLSCNGRYNYLKQIDGENIPISERISLLDPGCHPVLSFPDDLTLGSHLAYLLKQETINRKPTKGRPGRKKGSTNASLAAARADAAQGGGDVKRPGRKPGKLMHGMKNLSSTTIASNRLKRKYRKHNKNANNYNNDPNNWFGGLNNRAQHYDGRRKRANRAASMNENSNCSESSNHYNRPNNYNTNSAQSVTRRRRSEQSAYDIDNIVIPLSIAATTRVEILEYKEIMTPSWRVWENGTQAGENAPNKNNEVKIELPDDVEDTSDEAYVLRHKKGESEEKKRFSLKPPKTTQQVQGDINEN